MDYLIICLVAIVTSCMTLFSGFGLGTLLMPAFALFFPAHTAVALTAIVHLFNNLFKLVMLGKHANRHVVLRFGVPAILTAIVGAWALNWLSDIPPLASYQIGSHEFHFMPVKLVIGLLMIMFALLDLVPAFEKFSLDTKFLPLGGALSGFFGGLSGHQGALRSAFLLKCGLTKEGFIGTGIVIACLVDVTRISIYSSKFSLAEAGNNAPLLLSAILSALIGVLIGSRLIKKVTIRTIQVIVAIGLLGIAVCLLSGVI